ncbi:MAG: LamG-like jellyroll fold domain-containing protein, partial [Planctomycetota bacterium]
YIAGAYDSNLYALDPNEGTPRWVHDFRELVDANDFEGLPLASPAVGPDGTIYMLLPNPIDLYAIDPADGSVIWKAREAVLPSKYLAGRWQFESDAADSSGNGHHGLLQGQASIITDPERGNVLSLNGGYVEVPGYMGILGSSSRAMSAWIKTDVAGDILHWGNYAAGNGAWWLLYVDGTGALRVTVGGYARSVGLNLFDNEWHKVAAVFEGQDVGDVRLFVDGQEVNTEISNPAQQINTESGRNVRIGFMNSQNYRYFHGLIDDVRIYDLAFTIAGGFGTDPDAYCWQRPVIGPDGTIYVSFDDNYLRAFNPDGSVKWIKQVGTAGGFTLSVGSDGLIYAASEDGSLYVMNSSGTQISRLDGGDWLSQPVIGEDGTVYVCDVDSNVLAIDRNACDGPTADLHWIGDFNSDGAVNIDDIVILAFDWMQQSSDSYLAGDADRDMAVDLFDFAAVAAKWLDEI